MTGIGDHHPTRASEHLAPTTVPAPRAGDQDTGTDTAEAEGPVVFSPARLRAWRHARNLNHTTLAHAADTTTGHVQACEDGTTQPTPAMLTAWSRVLGCRTDQLCSHDPHAPAEYWNAVNQAMPRMSPEDLAIVAQVFTRTARDHHHDHPDR